MLWVCFCFLILTTKIFQFCFARIWKVDLFCFVVQVYDETNWNMPSRYFGAAVSSRAAGAEQKGCGCHMQDGGVPVGFCSFLLFFFFSPLSPSCITQLLGKYIHRCLGKQMLSSLDCHQKSLEDTFTSTPNSRWAKPKPAYWTRRGNKRWKCWPGPAIPPAKVGRPSSRPLKGLRIRPTWEVGEPLSFFSFLLLLKSLFFRRYVRRPICL